MKNVIITGAGGFLGHTLANRLLDRGVRVTAIDRSLRGLPEREGLTRVEMDLNKTDALLQAVPEGDYDTLYHFAWRGVNGPEKANPGVQTGNIRLAVESAGAAKALGCRRFLAAGTVAEFAAESADRQKKPSPGTLYGVAKDAAHRMLEAYCKVIDLPFVWMRFANIYGPGNRTGNLVSYTLDRLNRGEMAEYGPAEQPYDFIFSEDLMEAVCRLGDAPGAEGCYFVGSGTPRPLKDYLTEIGRICGKPELIGIGKRPDDGVVYRPDMFDIAPLVRVIGPYVKTSFEEGVRRTIREGRA